MKHLKTICLLAAVIATLASASAQLTIEECQAKAYANYPLLKRFSIIEQATEYSIKNIRKGWLPQLSASGQALYQSDVATLPDAMLSILGNYGYEYKGMKKDQYRLSLDLNQTIWDGGDLRAQQEVAAAEGRVQTAETEVDMYAVRSRVNELFFGLLLIEDKIRLNEELQVLLTDNCRKLESMLEHGTALQADADLMRAELLQTMQDMTSLLSLKQSYQAMLALFTGMETEEIISLQKPAAQAPATSVNSRPELALYDTQMAQAEAQRRQLNANLLPRLGFFAQGYYGRPGYDMFNDMLNSDLSLNGLIGLRLTWDISRFYTRKNDLRRIDLARQSIETARETFLFHNNLELLQELEAIAQYRKMMTEDEAIIALRGSIREAAEAKLEHGVIDVNDLLQEITRENQARIDHSSHEIEMLRNIYNLKTTINR